MFQKLVSKLLVFVPSRRMFCLMFGLLPFAMCLKLFRVSPVIYSLKIFKNLFGNLFFKAIY